MASDEQTALLIHEFGHEYESDHLSKAYYDALCKVGAALVRAMAEPGILGSALRAWLQ